MIKYICRPNDYISITDEWTNHCNVIAFKTQTERNILTIQSVLSKYQKSITVGYRHLVVLKQTIGQVKVFAQPWMSLNYKLRSIQESEKKWGMK